MTTSPRENPHGRVHLGTPRAALAPVPTAGAGPPLALIADADPSLRSLLGTRFQREGYRVLAVADGNEALRLAAQQVIDLVIVDSLLPGPDRRAVCPELVTPRPAAPPVVLMTSSRRASRPGSP